MQRLLDEPDLYDLIKMSSKLLERLTPRACVARATRARVANVRTAHEWSEAVNQGRALNLIG